VAGVRVRAFEARTVTLTRLGADTAVFLAGAGALALARQLPGCTVLPSDFVQAADLVDDLPAGPTSAPPSTSARAAGAGGR
jgi:hypothetical protein